MNNECYITGCRRQCHGNSVLCKQHLIGMPLWILPIGSEIYRRTRGSNDYQPAGVWSKTTTTRPAFYREWELFNPPSDAPVGISRDLVWQVSIDDPNFDLLIIPKGALLRGRRAQDYEK